MSFAIDDIGLIPLGYSPQPDWTGFKTALLTDPSFAAVYHVAGQNNLLVKDSLVPSLLQYEDGKTELFPTIFNAFCVAGEVTIEQRQEWRTMAESFHLPDAFLNVIFSEDLAIDRRV